MANIKISELIALTTPAAADELPVVDVDASATKKATVSNIVIAGAKELARGTAAEPAVAFGGAADTNTGIYSPGADQLALSTNGTGRLFINANGSVTAPQGTFTLGTSGAVNAIINSADGIFLNIDSDNTTTGEVFVVGKDRTGASGGTELFRITEAGLVGIGTSIVDAKFHVAGDSVDGTQARITGATNQNYQLRWGFDTTNLVGRIQSIHAGTAYKALSLNPDGGNVGIGTTSPGGALEVNAAASTAPAIFKINTSEAARIDSSGRLLVGTSSARTQFFGSLAAASQVEGNSTSTASISITRNDATADTPYLIMGHARGTGNQVVSADDGLGRISFQGADGAKFVQAAQIGAFVDGSPAIASADLEATKTYRIVTVTSSNWSAVGGPNPASVGNVFTATGGAAGLGTAILNAGNMPGRLVFSTTPSGSASPVEQLRITSDRYVRLASGTGGIQFNGDTASANALDDYEEGTWTPALAGSTTAGTYETTFASGWYTKIGRQVTVQFRINLAGSITGGGVGFAIITGLPFNTSTDNYANGGSVLLGSVDFNDTAKHLYLYKRSTTSAQLIISEVFDNAAPQDVGIADFAASSIIAGSLVYFIS